MHVTDLWTICGWFSLEGLELPDIERRGSCVFQNILESSWNVEVWMELARKAPSTFLCASVVPYIFRVRINGRCVWFGKRTCNDVKVLWIPFLEHQTPRLILEVSQDAVHRACPFSPIGHNGPELQPVLAVFSVVLTFNSLFLHFLFF